MLLPAVTRSQPEARGPDSAGDAVRGAWLLLLYLTLSLLCCYPQSARGPDSAGDAVRGAWLLLLYLTLSLLCCYPQSARGPDSAGDAVRGAWLLLLYLTSLYCVATRSQPEALTQLVTLYVGRSFPCWKEPEVVTWLERNVNEVVRLVDSGDPRVKDFAEK